MKGEWFDQPMSQFVSQPLIQPEEKLRKIKEKLRSRSLGSNSGGGGEKVQNSLVDRVRERKQNDSNMQHKDFLKKRSGQQYDPLEAMKKDQYLKTNTPSRRPRSAQKSP